MALPENTPLHDVHLSAYLADISTASSTFIASPVRGRIIIAYSTIHAAITGADCTWTVEINDVAATGTCTVANASSAPGDVDSVVLTAGHYVNIGDRIEFKSAGESSTTSPATFTAVVRVGSA